MQQILESVGLLVILLIVLRVSLSRRGRGFQLRGGLTAVNLICGALTGLAWGMALRRATAPPDPDWVPADGYPILLEALRNLLPLGGLALGGIAGYLLLGALWRRLFRGGSARARAWLLRSEVLVSLANAAVLVWSLSR
jgi:hypothetical protein